MSASASRGRSRPASVFRGAAGVAALALVAAWLLFRASVGVGQPAQVADAGDVKFDADGQLVHVDG
jgi:hypothetical protein